MEEGHEIPLPKTDVSFAPTAAFARKYPSELAEQNAKFNTPTWQQRTAEPEPPKRVCTPVPSPQKRDPVFDYLHDDNVAMGFGAIFFVLLAYLAVRGVQWHLN
jgi:hypothetical protein